MQSLCSGRRGVSIGRVTVGPRQHRKDRDMVRHDQEPAGDYGYDLVHEVDKGFPGLAPETPQATPNPLRPAAELDGDYGYDEAHDL
jgi:hypothetical protein